jgi:threonine synthase
VAEWTLVCRDCGWQHVEDQYYVGCPACGGFIEVAFASAATDPVDRRFSSIFKYHPVMPYDPVHEDIARFENLDETPCIFAERTSEKLGIELYYKDETCMPSGTWKDREGFVSIYRLLRNKVPALFAFSSGNTGTSLARSASMMRGPQLHLVVPRASERRLATYRQFFDPDFVRVHLFDGSNDECVAHAKQLAAQMGIVVEGGFTNYARREGLKLFGLELALAWDRKADWYVQPVAGGIGVYSLHKAYRDLGRRTECPRILGVQATICAPMVYAWRADAATLEERYVPQTVEPSPYVRVLRTRRPADSYPILKQIVDEVGGRFEDVSDGEIHEGLRLLYLDDYYRDRYRSTGVLCGLEPATALAGVCKGVRQGYIARGERVLLNISGAAKAGDIRMEWIEDLI